MGVLGAFFGCRGDGGFTLVCISGCRGVVGFNVATSQMPVREKVRPAHEKWPTIGVLWRAGRTFSRVSGGEGVPGEFCRVYRHGSQVSQGMWRPTCRKWWGFCTTRSPLAACRRRVGASCSAIPPSGGRGGVRTCRGPGGWPLRLAVLTRRCAAKPYWWHGGQPAQATTSRVNVRIKGRSCPPAECQVLGFVEACLGRFLSCCCVLVFCLLWCDSAQGEVRAACVVPVDPG